MYLLFFLKKRFPLKTKTKQKKKQKTHTFPFVSSCNTCFLVVTALSLTLKENEGFQSSGGQILMAP